MSLSGGIVKGCKNAFLVNDAHAFGTHFEGNPHILFRNIELLGLKIRGEGTFGVDTGMGNVVTTNHFLTSNFTNLCQFKKKSDFCSRFSTEKTLV